MKKNYKYLASCFTPSNTSENESNSLSPKTIIAIIAAVVAVVLFAQYKYDFFPMIGFAVLFTGIIQLIQFLFIYGIRKELKSALGIRDESETTLRSPKEIVLRILLKILVWFIKFELFYLGSALLMLLALSAFGIYPGEEEFIKVAAGSFLCGIGFLILGFRSDLAGIIYNFKTVKKLNEPSLYFAIIISVALVLAMRYIGYTFDLNPILVQLPILPFGLLVSFFQKLFK